MAVRKKRLETVMNLQAYLVKAGQLDTVYGTSRNGRRKSHSILRKVINIVSHSLALTDIKGLRKLGNTQLRASLKIFTTFSWNQISRLFLASRRQRRMDLCYDSEISRIKTSSTTNY